MVPNVLPIHYKEACLKASTFIHIITHKIVAAVGNIFYVLLRFIYVYSLKRQP
jgi:hypothetical protein